MALSKTPPAKALPDDALQALQRLCASTTQTAVARRLGVSDGTISNALNGRYIGNVERLAERIRGELLDGTVQCPVLGPVSLRICQDERGKGLYANPLRIQMYRACMACDKNPDKGERE